jgi:pimeloyl-ACP methyl ester carboxylesterase
MITGSGAQNRNEELMGHKPFLVIADYLTRNGIAVLRIDDRGVGQTQAGSGSPTTFDFASDIQSAFDFLKSRKEIDPKFTGLIGHSEGGMIAPIVAASNHDIAFIISLSGTGVTGEEILYRQTYDINKASGMKMEELKSSLRMAREMYAVLKREPDNKKATQEMSSILHKTLVKQKSSPEDVKKALDQFPVSAATLTSPWFRTFIVLNPADYWKKVTCPVLALNGEKDLQVAFDVNLPAIRKALRSGGNNKVTIRSFPDLNHLYQHCKTGLISEYGEIEETFSPEVLKVMSDWIHGLRPSLPAL